MEYNFREIEKKWQKRWVENKTYQVTEDETKKKFYVLNMFPYPSGAGLHVGHPLGYIASDIYARYKRLQGFNVLNPMGYDAYGLPAEQYAIQTGQHPAITTVNNINRYREQLDKIGFSFDWNREIRTCEPEYYHWTQWAFQKMFNSYYCNDEKQARPIQELIEAFSQTGTEGINVACSEELSFTAAEWNAKSEKEQQEILMNYRIAYLGETMVNWCPQLGTVLANDEVVDGVSERGGFPVIQKKMRQWCLRVSAYAQRLLDVLDTLIDKLSRLQNVPILQPLRQIQELLNRIDAQPVGTTLPLYDEILSIVKNIGVGYEPKYLFQTDMFKPVHRAQVDEKTVSRIVRLIDFLAKITPPNEHPTLQNFIQAFQSRYEEAEVPLAVALDGELGLGYPVSSGSGDVNPLINDLVFPGRYSNAVTVTQTPADRILFEKYIENARKGGHVVLLEDKDFEKLDYKHQFPDTIAVMCSLLDNDLINIKSIGGVCAANLLGRFCHIDESIMALVKEIADFEQRQTPDVIFAEISHLPESRIGNIASRPVFREHTLHYLSNCEHDGTDIPISDLMLSIRQGRLFLRSKKYDKEVVPRLTCAHNYSMSPIPIYRFLCDLQHQRITGGLSCGWSGLLAAYDYLPRIQYKDIILSRELWRIKQEEVEGMDKLSDSELSVRFREFLQKRQMPTEVVIPDSDNELYLNLEDTQCQRLLLEEIAKRKQIVLEEFLFRNDSGIVRRGKDRFTNEVIFAFHKNEQHDTEKVHTR